MTGPKRLYATTPIYYVNDVPHPGHAYTTIAADALTRARRLQGHDAYLLTGTDEHGQNIERIAREKGVPPIVHCDQVVAVFKALWDRLEIRYDDFIRTTSELHRRGVLALWKTMRTALAPNGEPAVYRGTYAGWYCPRCEEFKDEDELKEPGHLCPVHERPAEWTEEDNFFFRLSAYGEWLRGEIEKGAARRPGERGEGILIEPVSRRNEVLAVIRDGLKDFSISRARVKWGIPVPEEPSHVFYVWMDALSNYVTALGYADGDERYERYWARADERLHFVGKEIIRFHCLYWPAMLHAAGVPIPSRVFAHGWLTRDGKKLSKTTGNTIDPDALLDGFGVDAFRYFFLREGSFGQDWDYTDDAFVKRFNSDLANDFGNLVSRALTMVARYCDGRVPARPARRTSGGAEPFGAEEDLQHRCAQASGEIWSRYEALDFAGALQALWQWVGWLNQRIVQFAPWEAAKDPGRRADLEAFLYRLLEGIRFVAVHAWPVVPRASTRVLGMLGLAPTDPAPEDLAWGRLDPGRPLGTIEPLFPRIETADGPKRTHKKKEDVVSESRPPAPAGPPVETTQAAPPGAPQIDIAEFGRLDLRVAQVTAAERIQGSKRLLKLQVDLGGETRQIVSGIADAYEPESLVGRKVVLVANLKPAKLMGVESFGMVLAASLDGRAVLCTFDQDVPVGTKVK